MTTGLLLSQSSTVINVAALIHLQNLRGTGEGIDHWFPYTDITVEFEEQDLKVNFDEQDLSVEFIDDILLVNFEEDGLDVTFDTEILDINITCE